MPLGLNVLGVTITGKKYRQYIAIAPAWKEPYSAFRDINAGDALFQRAHSEVGISAFTIPGGKKIWIFVADVSGKSKTISVKKPKREMHV